MIIAADTLFTGLSGLIILIIFIALAWRWGSNRRGR